MKCEKTAGGITWTLTRPNPGHTAFVMLDDDVLVTSSHLRSICTRLGLSIQDLMALEGTDQSRQTAVEARRRRPPESEA